MCGEIIEFFIIKQIKKPRLVLCSVVKHLGSGRALKKWEKTLDCVSCFPLHFFRALPLPKCFTTEHSTVEAFLFVKYVQWASFDLQGILVKCTAPSFFSCDGLQMISAISFGWFANFGKTLTTYYSTVVPTGLF